VPDLHIRPRHRWEIALSNTLDGRDLVFLNGNGGFADTDDLNDTGSPQNGQTIVRVHAAEEITREQRQRNYF
jgi:hypothetical protein